MSICVSVHAGDRSVSAIRAGSVSGGGEAPEPGGRAGPGKSGLDQQLPPLGDASWG